MTPDALDPVQAALRAAYERSGLPFAAHLDLTYRCDLDCQHCYLDDKAWPEMTTAEILRLLEQLSTSGVLDLRWSGGEVLRRPDFLQLLARAAELGFLSRVKTHAGLVTAEVASALQNSRVQRIDVSVYSLQPAVHDAFTRSSGSLQRTLAGIAHLRDAGLAVRVSMSVQPHTIEEMPLLFEHFRALGCAVEFATHVFRDHAGGDRLEVLDLVGEDRIRAEAWRRRLLSLDAAVPASLRESGSSAPCGAGRTLAYISPDGSVWPCVSFPMALGNVRERSFADIWRTSAARQELLAWTNAERTTCQTCAGSGFCSYCPGEAFKVTGDFRSAPSGFHAATRARMAAFEEVSGERLPQATWASVPAGETPRTARKTVFPIHRPEKGRGRRVTE